MRRGPAHGDTVTSPSLKLLQQRLIDATSIRLSKLRYFRYFLFKPAKNFGSVFPDRSDLWTYESKFQTRVSFLFFHFLYVVSL
jgi:hypothetical protein